MENAVIKFTLSKKELFWLYILAYIKTAIVALVVGVVLGFVGLMVYALDSFTPAVDWQNYYQNAFLLSLLTLGAGAIYGLGVMIFSGIRVLAYSKNGSTMFDERIIAIEKERAIVLYADDKKEIIKWGQYKIHFENQKYMILKSDINTFILKKNALSSQDLTWLKQNLKEQNIIEYRKKIQAKRNR
ncbi:MAG TPA: hypothetical protein GX745_05030 [Clostridiales bacterium]|nr:hypothetical protein [Clostridiales bacterium]